MKIKLLFLAVVILGFTFLAGRSSFAQGTAFTYQGQINDGTNPATGLYDIRSVIYDSTSGGSLIAGPLTNSIVGVTNGLFTISLDFGPGVFSGALRWLEIGVRTNGSASFTTLNPRQQLTPVPYAITAANLVGNGLAAGTYGSAFAFTNGANVFSGSFNGSGSGLTGVNAVTLNGFGYCALPCYWNLSGNAGTSGANFLGTSDNQPLTVKVNGTIALQILPGTTLPNIVAGGAGFRPTFIATGVSGAVVAGGDAPSSPVTGFGGGDFHAVYDNDGTVGGGFGNKVGSNNGDVTDAAFATVAGGVFNTASAYAATVGGGDGNQSGGVRSVVAGGSGNIGAADYDAIGGGLSSVIQLGSLYSVIAGGQANSIGSNSPNATIGGGYQNIMVTNDPFSTISGGVSNKITAYNFIIGSMTAATIAGGFQNIISNQASFASIGGGQQNSCAGGFGTVGGGFQNSTQGGNDTIAGGYQNATTPNAATSTIGGGMQNFIDQAESTISGGYRNTNTVTAVASVIGGGQNNLITNSTATISGGRFNIAGGLDSVVPGGDLNSAMGRSSYASGFRAKATNDGAFVWADLQNSDFSSTLDNSVSFRCANGVKFSNGASSGANVAVSWSPGTGAWVFSSDRSLKEGFETVDALTILDKVTQLPISEWNYKGYSQRHIGVMAQDFHAAFPLNESTTTLNDADLHGVALAAIQGLNEKLTEELKRRDVENEQLKQEVDGLKAMMEKLNQKINGGGN